MAMMTDVTGVTELPAVAVRAPALLHVQRRRTIVRPADVAAYGRRQRHVVDESET